MAIRLLTAITLLLGLAIPAGAQQIHLGAHFHDHEEFLKVIDLRCTVCHTRERIEQAMEEKRDLAQIQKRMVERGAQLSERDRSVLGTFWGDPFKEKASSTEQ